MPDESGTDDGDTNGDDDLIPMRFEIFQHHFCSFNSNTNTDSMAPINCRERLLFYALQKKGKYVVDNTKGCRYKTK